MPRHARVRKLEELSLNLVCKSFASACETLEAAFSAASRSRDVTSSSGGGADDVTGRYWLEQESKFLSVISSVPGKILEVALSQTIELIVEQLRRHRSHPGLVKSVQYLARSNLERLDFKALFSGVRLYGEPNAKCKETLRKCIGKMTFLTHLNLTSKCDDAVMLSLAQNCHKLEELYVPLSDITDVGLLAICGISFSPERGALSDSDGCLGLTKLGVRDCVNISQAGVGSCLRNLPNLSVLYYGKLVDAIETVLVIDGDYLKGKKQFNITHLDQFSEFYDLESHPIIVHLLVKVCPKLSSLRFYISDEGCMHLSQIPNVEKLHLETEDLDNGFRMLIKHYTNLTELQLTFRKMAFSRMMNIADSCPNLEILEMTGMGVEGSQNLRPCRKLWQKLRVLNMRLVCQEDPLPLLHYLLNHSHRIEDILVSIVCHVFNSMPFLQLLLDSNPMVHVQKLVFVVSPNGSLTLDVARRVVKLLPSLHVFGVKRWNMTNAETVKLMEEIKSQNYDVKLV